MKKLSKIKNKRDKLYAKIKDKNSCIFSNDLESLLNANNSAREKYLEEARNFYKLNQFRNIFAHQLRMLWWKNRELWGFYSKHYDNIKLGNRDELWPVISEFTDTAKVLKGTCDTIATFLNSTFALIDHLLLSEEIQRTNYTI